MVNILMLSHYLFLILYSITFIHLVENDTKNDAESTYRRYRQPVFLLDSRLGGNDKRLNTW
jgi:hypothetical protein